MKEQIALQHAVKNRFDTLRIRYPRYSLRAFAKKAGVSPATLSLVLQGKRKVSKKLAQQLSDKLNFDPQERSEVFRPYLDKKSKSFHAQVSPEYVQLTVDQYQLISDWRAFAILNLIKTKNFKNDVSWMARRLAISTDQVNETIERLLRLEMLERKGNELLRTTVKYRTTEDIANSSLHKSHQQTLDLAHASLENDAVDQRDFTWVTFAMDSKKISEAKTLIRKFQDELYSLVSENAEPDEVYRLSVQLFPLTKNEARTKK